MLATRSVLTGLITLSTLPFNFFRFFPIPLTPVATEDNHFSKVAYCLSALSVVWMHGQTNKPHMRSPASQAFRNGLSQRILSRGGAQTMIGKEWIGVKDVIAQKLPYAVRNERVVGSDL